jgi:hypothetical protein
LDRARLNQHLFDAPVALQARHPEGGPPEDASVHVGAARDQQLNDLFLPPVRRPNESGFIAGDSALDLGAAVEEQAHCLHLPSGSCRCKWIRVARNRFINLGAPGEKEFDQIAPPAARGGDERGALAL